MVTDPPKASKSGRWQFSLRSLFVGVAFVAVGCVGLFNPSHFWRASIGTATLTMLLVATIAAVSCKGGTRAFAVAFTMVGWSYLVISTMARIHVHYAPHHLLQMIIDDFYTSLLARGGQQAYDNFFSIGHHLWAILLAYLGGLLARYFYTTREDES